MSRFLVLEGLDGAGTTTQLARLATWLRARGLSVLETREPTTGPIGRLIRATLRADADAPAEGVLPWLFAADRADHLHRLVQPALQQGTWVLSDRYLHSSLAYQSLVAPLRDVYDLNRTFRVPDLTVFVHVPVGVALDRIAARGAAREIYEHRDRLEQVAAAYADVLALLEQRGDRIVRVDGTQSIDEVETDIRQRVTEMLP
jgi:dTMP kinase